MTSPTGPVTPTAVRVLIVDDQQLIRESIAALLAIQPGIEVVGTASDGSDAINQTLATDPDIVLMDVRMPTMDGVEAVTVLSQHAPRTRVVMLTTFDDEDYVVRALRAGARGYLLKDRPARELAEAVKLAHAGVVQFDPAAAARITAALNRATATPVTPAIPSPTGRSDSAAGHGGVTTREVEILRLVATGATNREIAGLLFVSEGTVKNHISRILTRLGLRDRTQAALYARNHGLL